MFLSLSSLILLSVLPIHCYTPPFRYMNCDYLGILIYDEIGCKPIRSIYNNCPAAYNCSKYQIPKEGCLFEQHVYKNGEVINGTDPCRNCKCSSNAKNGSKIECQRPFPFSTIYYKIDGNCYQTFELNKCYNSVKCPPYGCQSICVVDNVVYVEGQKFNPPDRCMDCVCQKGFNGNYVEPFCRKKRCDVEISFSKQIADNCAVLYSKKQDLLCCPENFICPSNAKVENLVKFNFRGKLGECKFGSQTFQKYDKMNLVYGNNVTATCNCTLPPLLTCRE